MPEFTIDVPADSVETIEEEAAAADQTVEAYLEELIVGGIDTSEDRDRGIDDAGSASTADGVSGLKQAVSGLRGGSADDTDDDDGDESDEESAETSTTVAELKETVSGLGRREPDRSETVEHLRTVALDEETGEETTAETIRTLGSVGPQAETALAEIANSDIPSETRQLALEQIRAINDD